MEIKVKLSNLRTTPRKVRQVVDLVRGKKVLEAQSILLFTVNKSARPVLKLLNSAIASAKHDFHLEESNLFISEITVDEGPKLKRWHPMSRGRAYPIIKRSAHVALIIKELSSTDKTPVKEVKTKEVVGSEKKVVAKKVTKKIVKTKESSETKIKKSAKK
jgi:large subunit ribosomal protein L22